MKPASPDACCGDPRRIADLTYDELTRIPLFPTDAPGACKAAPLPLALEDPPLVTTPDNAPEGYYQHVPLFADVLKWSPAAYR